MNNSSKKMQTNESEEEHVPSHKDESGFVKTFPQRLFELLSSVEDSSQSITWTPTGDAFLIVDQATFVDNILPIFFKRTKFTSFKGKLYRWGFRRVSKGANAGAYFHKLFLKDDPTLCLHMRRQMKGKNVAAVKDTLTPEEAASGPSTSTVERRKTANKQQDRTKTDTKSNVVTPALLPQPQISIDVSQLESGASPPLPYPDVNQLPTHGQVTNPGLPKANIPKSAFVSSKNSIQALLNAQAFSNMLRNAHQDVTRALVEEGERIGDLDYTNRFSMQSRFFGNQNTDAMMTQIATRLSNSKLNEGQQDNSLRNFCLQGNANATFPRPSAGLLALHKNMFNELRMVPSTSNMDVSNPMISQCYPHEQRSDYQLNTTQALNHIQSNPDVFSQERLSNSENRSNLLSAMSQEQDSQNQGVLPSDWSLDDGSTHSSNSTQLDLLSNAALAFRIPFSQEYRTMDEPMQDKDEESVIVVNGKLKVASPLPRHESAYGFKGQMV